MTGGRPLHAGVEAAVLDVFFGGHQRLLLTFRAGRAGWLQRGVRVAHDRQVAGARARVELLEQPVVERAGLQLRHAAVRVVDVAEHDRVGRARRLARRHHLAVANLAIVELGRHARVVDALHAVGALLHHAAAADGDVGVALQLEAGRVEVLIQQEVEPPHLVGAVVRAVARADAAVVDHVVQAFVAVRRGRHRAHHLARRRLALLARHRLVIGVGGVEIAGVVAVDAQPVHLAAVEDLALADHRHVVLGLAGDHAGVAAGADVLIDRHAPRVAFVLEVRRGVERQRLGLMLLLLRELRVGGELRRRRDANQVAALERPVVLRGGQLVAVARLRQLHAAERVGRRRSCAAR